jgi:glycosyltransferase involved in cell wall biosynthesis
VRILYHHRTRAGDAQGIHIQSIISAFRDLGHQVEVAALTSAAGGSQSAPARSPRPRGGRELPAGLYDLLSMGYNAYGYRMLRRMARTFRPDFIYERYSLNTVCGILAARHLGVPLILEVNAPLAREQEQLGRLAFRALARASERWICSNSTRTIVVSGVLRDLLAADGVPREQMVVMTNGVDQESFHPAVRDAGLRRTLQLEDRLVVGFVGWFRKWHGLDLLLEAYRETRLAEKGARLLLVGDGPARPDLDRFVAENGLTQNVVFTGPVHHTQIPAYVAAMDVAVQPNAPEYACPMKIVEYMAMAKCVVAPDQPNIREIVEDGHSGLLFPPGDRRALGQVLLRVVQEADTRQALGRHAIDTVTARRFFWKDNAARILALAAPRRGPDAVR